MSADRSRWIAAALRARKPSVQGEILVRRLGASGGYAVELRVEDEDGTTRLPIAQLQPAGRSRWRLEWTAGDGVWKPLDAKERTLDETLDAIAKDDFGCFFG